MLLSSFLALSEEERLLLINSIQRLMGKLDILVEKFYFYFLQSNNEIKRLFSQTDMIKQQNMFNVAIGVLITNVGNPDLIQDNLDVYVKKHLIYGVTVAHVQYFVDAITKSFSELLINEEMILKAWIKVFYGVMEYFKSKM